MLRACKARRMRICRRRGCARRHRRPPRVAGSIRAGQASIAKNRLIGRQESQNKPNHTPPPFGVQTKIPRHTKKSIFGMRFCMLCMPHENTQGQNDSAISYRHQKAVSSFFDRHKNRPKSSDADWIHRYPSASDFSNGDKKYILRSRPGEPNPNCLQFTGGIAGIYFCFSIGIQSSL